MRRALAIQLIINREWGLAKNENPNQGAFIIEELTDLVEEAVLKEFERISERGGVLGAMETGYQRGKIQDESRSTTRQEARRQLPDHRRQHLRQPRRWRMPTPELVRSTEAEKQSQIAACAPSRRGTSARPRRCPPAAAAATAGGNIFAVLVDAVRVLSLGQITRALFEVGGQYRRSM